MNWLFFKEKERIKMTQRPQMEQLKKRAEAFHQKPSPDYGKVIRRYREIQEITREQLAELMDYSTKGWEKIETGKNKVSLDLLEKAAYVLGFSVLYESGQVFFSHTEDQSRRLIHQFLAEWQKQLDGLKGSAIPFQELKTLLDRLLIEKYSGEGAEFIFNYREECLEPLIHNLRQTQFMDVEEARSQVEALLSSQIEMPLETLKWAFSNPASMSCFDLEFDLEGYVFNLYLTFDIESEEMMKQQILEVLNELPSKVKSQSLRLRDWSDYLLSHETLQQELLISNLRVVAMFKS